MPYAFNGTTPNLNWAVNRLNRVLTTSYDELKQRTTDLNNKYDTLKTGAGYNSPNATVETAVQWMINKASNNYITYSQSNRNLNNPNGTSYDCSSFVITAFNYAGFGVSATYTGDMVRYFTAKGFTWYAKSYLPASELRRGDILIKQTGPNGHTQVYIGNNQDVNCGGTPARVTTHSPDNWGRGGWDGYLRYGTSGGMDDPKH